MQRLDINSLIEFSDRKFNPVVLANGTDMRVVLLCLRAGQQVHEHSVAGGITVQAITGRVTFYEGEEACELSAGTLVRLDAGRAHRVEAHTDAALLVTMVKTAQPAERLERPRAAERELDLCLIPRPERHPLVFDAFDRLAVGESFVVFNDHDPRPLRMQIEQMRGGELEWEYVERGPDTFRVRIKRIAPPKGNVGPVNSGTAESLVNIG
jgi:uncharacterized protein (DUF2249 family)/quercetin dioxygenase-like cupin family protein